MKKWKEDTNRNFSKEGTRWPLHTLEDAQCH